MKLLWTGVKSIVNIKNKTVNIITKLKETNGNLTTDSATMANTFNNFLSMLLMVSQKVYPGLHSLPLVILIRIIPIHSASLLQPHMKFQT